MIHFNQKKKYYNKQIQFRKIVLMNNNNYNK